MKKQLLTVLFATAALTLSAGAHAQGEAAAKSAGCLKCHDVAKDGDAPSYKKVSAKFGKDAGKVAASFEKVEDHKKVKAKLKGDDLKNIAAWIVTL